MSSSEIQKIASAILRSVSGIDAAHAGTLGCGSFSQGVAFNCTGSIQTFGCDTPQIYNCGGTSGKFTCATSGAGTDDFECELTFNCASPDNFECLTSFDNEDCENSFICGPFTCASAFNN